MKKIIAGVLALTLVSGFVPFNNNITDKYTVYAQGEKAEYTEGDYGYLKYRNYGDYIEISGCHTSAAVIEIPSEIDGVAVTSIGKSAFFYCKSLISVTIPDSITSIGYKAFDCCEALTSVTIPDSITSISDSAFFSCKSLSSVTIPDSVTSIGIYAFACCEALTSVTIPDNVTSIGDGAFEYCYTLTSVTIENPNCEIYDSPYTISNSDENFTGTIYGYENSTAQAYAEKYNRKFVSLEEAPIDNPTLPLGDINGDSTVDASDASNVLEVYALVSTGKDSELTEEQKKAADVNKDGSIDSSDASIILAYYAYTQTGGTDTLEEYLNS